MCLLSLSVTVKYIHFSPDKKKDIFFVLSSMMQYQLFLFSGSNHLYMAGGEFPDGSASRSMWRYDPCFDSWQEMASMNMPRSELGKVSRLITRAILPLQEGSKWTWLGVKCLIKA